MNFKTWLSPSHNSSQSYKCCSHSNDFILFFFLFRIKIHLPNKIQKLQGVDTITVLFKPSPPTPQTQFFTWCPTYKQALSTCWVTRKLEEWNIVRHFMVLKRLFQSTLPILTTHVSYSRGPSWTILNSYNQFGWPNFQVYNFLLNNMWVLGTSWWCFLHATLNSLDQGSWSICISNKLPGDMMLSVIDHTWSGRDLELEWLAFSFDRTHYSA